jgi:deazaflavin-dependent oxidoreductase (nitroreductase family)
MVTAQAEVTESSGRVREGLVARRLVPVAFAAVLSMLGALVVVRVLVSGASAETEARAAHPAIRRFVTHRFNSVVMTLGLAGDGWSPWGVVTHVGRTSGRTYATPILPHRAGDVVLIPLTYGSGVHWVRNVKAAGVATIRVHGHTFRVVDPVVEPASGAAPLLSAPWRALYRVIGMAGFLRLSIVREPVAA